MSRRHIDTVLMEFDGVLAETAGAREHALLSVLLEDGITLPVAEYRDRCLGLPTPDAVRYALAHAGVALDETGVELLALRIDRAFTAHVSKGVLLVDGAREAIERLSSRVRVGIVTRANRRDVEFVLSLAQIDAHVACIIGAEDVYPGKPAATPYQAALRRLERRRPIPEEGIVVALEDALVGIRAARAAGLRCIAVGPLDAHIALEADALIPALTGLDLATIERLVARDGEQFA